MKIFQLYIIIFLISFQVESQEKLSNNSTIKLIFNTTEIQDLEKIMDFFNEQICSSKSLSEEKETECYMKFIDRMLESAESGMEETLVSFNNQEDLYSEINKETFNEIWDFEGEWKRNSLDTIKRINYNTQGKYAEFLRKLSVDSKVIESYHESFESAGGISPSSWTFLLMRKYYKIEDIRLRLVIAINYLTLNDYAERNEKY